MKKFTYSKILICAFLLFTGNISQAQVGVNTTTPKGALDLNATTTGLVYPRVTLTKTNVALPVVNPNGGALVEGTVVYNTSKSTSTSVPVANGTNDVYPGIYAWINNKWEPQYIREHYKKYSQYIPTPTPPQACQRTDMKPSANTKDPIVGLDNKKFTPKYTGKYKIKVSNNYGAGQMTDFSNTDISVVSGEGNFYFSLSGPNLTSITNFPIYTHSYSVLNKFGSPTTLDNNIMHYSSVVFYRTLTQGEIYNLNLSIAIEAANDNDFVLDGDSGNGLGHIGHDIPCTVEFTYLGD